MLCKRLVMSVLILLLLFATGCMPDFLDAEKREQQALNEWSKKEFLPILNESIYLQNDLDRINKESEGRDFDRILADFNDVKNHQYDLRSRCSAIVWKTPRQEKLVALLGKLLAAQSEIISGFIAWTEAQQKVQFFSAVGNEEKEAEMESQQEAQNIKIQEAVKRYRNYNDEIVSEGKFKLTPIKK